MRKTNFYFDEHTLWHSGGYHALVLPVGGWVQPPSASGNAESPESKRRMKCLMDVSGISAKINVLSAAPASEEDLLRVHPEHYLEKFKRVSDAGGGDLGSDAFDDHAPIGPGSYEIAKLSTGLAIAAVEAVLLGEADNAYSLSRPPGHHCLPDTPMGYCFLANIAVAIETAKARHGLGKVVVLDWDVHHGNGTQAIFYDRPDVLTISIHQNGCFPAGYAGIEDRGEGAGLGANINIPLMTGAGHESYIETMHKIVIPAIERFEPEIIIVACGFDANSVDPLARMMAHSDTYREMTRLVREAAERLCQGKLVLVHEGGYSEAYVPFCGLAVVEELSGHRTDVVDHLRDYVELQQPCKDHRQLQSKLIADMAKIFLA